MAHTLSQRSQELELMDDLDCSGQVVRQTLRELDVINHWLGGNRVTLSAFENLISNHTANSKLSIADIGCGSGDMLKRISQWGARHDRLFRLTGIDANPSIIAYAKEKSNAYEIEFMSCNVWSPEFRELKFDVILATLFLHHFTDEELAKLIARLRSQARVGIIINDIHRHWLAFHSIKILTQLFSRSKMVKFDAPLSVRRAFKRKDLEAILASAKINSFKLKWKWAFRWQLVIPGSLA